MNLHKELFLFIYYYKWMEWAKNKNIIIILKCRFLYHTATYPRTHILIFTPNNKRFRSWGNFICFLFLFSTLNFSPQLIFYIFSSSEKKKVRRVYPGKEKAGNFSRPAYLHFNKVNNFHLQPIFHNIFFYFFACRTWEVGAPAYQTWTATWGRALFREIRF